MWPMNGWMKAGLGCMAEYKSKSAVGAGRLNGNYKKFFLTLVLMSRRREGKCVSLFEHTSVICIWAVSSLCSVAFH